MSRTHRLYIAVMLMLMPWFQASIAAAGNAEKPSVAVFTRNDGQWDEKILFQASIGDATLWLTRDGVYYEFVRFEPEPGPVAGEKTHASKSGQRLLVKATFLNSNPAANIVAGDQVPFPQHFYIGNDPKRWRTDVLSFTTLTYEGLYEGIDLIYHIDRKGLSYRYILNPGAKDSAVDIGFEGLEDISWFDGDKLKFDNEWGYVKDIINPSGYGDFVERNGTPVLKAGLLRSAEIQADSSAGDALKDANVPQLELLVSTFLNGSSIDYGNDIALSSSGAACITGYTTSPDFGGTFGSLGLDDDYNGSGDAFVVKMVPGGTAVPFFITYLGGSQKDEGMGIVVGENDIMYVTGYTLSDNFFVWPPEAAYQSEFASTVAYAPDAFLTALTSNGKYPYFSTYLGGYHADYGMAVDLDDDGFIYVVGGTMSSDFPVPSGYDMSHNGEYDAFVSKFLPDASELVWSTFVGGSLDDWANDLVVENGAVYFTGYTYSPDYPIKYAYDETYNGNEDAVCTKLSQSGSLSFSTYLGGSNSDVGVGIDFGVYKIINPLPPHNLITKRNVFITGSTNSSDFPRQGYDETYNGSYDVFVTQLEEDATYMFLDTLIIIYSTYLGGTGSDVGNDISVDDDGNATIVGYAGTGYPLEYPYDNYSGNTDAVITKLTNNGSYFWFSSYLGGTAGDEGNGLAVDEYGVVHVTGGTYSSNFPFDGSSYGSVYKGNGDGFYSVLAMGEETCGDMLFEPAEDGWSFSNEEGVDFTQVPPDVTNAIMWPETWWSQFDYCTSWWYILYFCGLPAESWYFPDWQLWAEVFGYQQCYYDWSLYHVPSAYARELWYIHSHRWAGSCFGFSISSLLYFGGFLSIGSEFPGNTLLNTVAFDDHVRSIINHYYVYQYGAEYQACKNDKQHIDPNTTLLECQRMFVSDNRNDRALILRWPDPEPDQLDHMAGHSVVPYRCEVKDADTTYLYIYDNNYPNDSTRVVKINTTENSWKAYGYGPACKGTDNLFLTNQVSTYLDTPTLERKGFSENNADETGSKMTGIPSSVVEIYFDKVDSCLIANNIGEMGFNSGGIFNDFVFGGPIIPITGRSERIRGYSLSNIDWDAELMRTADSSAGNDFQVTYFLDSAFIAFQENDVGQFDPGELIGSKLGYVADDTSLWEYTGPVLKILNDSATNFSMTGCQHYSDSELTINLADITKAPYDSCAFKFTAEGPVYFANYGSATTFDLRVQIAGAAWDTVPFIHENISISNNTAIKILIDWTQHDSLEIRIDSGMAGDFSVAVWYDNQRSTLCGDASGDDAVNIGDAVFLINYIFKGGPAPEPLCVGDADGDDAVNIGDAVYLINYIFKGGPAPVEPCCP